MMKTKTILGLALVLSTFTFLSLSFAEVKDRQYETISVEDIIEIPSQVQAILKDKCMNCHSTDAKNFKSKSKLNFDKFSNGDYSTNKIAKKMDKIVKQLNKNKMPPEKHLSKHPEKKLTTEESDLLKSWAKSEAKKLAAK